MDVDFTSLAMPEVNKPVMFETISRSRGESYTKSSHNVPVNSSNIDAMIVDNIKPQPSVNSSNLLPPSNNKSSNTLPSAATNLSSSSESSRRQLSEPFQSTQEQTLDHAQANAMLERVMRPLTPEEVLPVLIARGLTVAQVLEA